MRKVFSFVVWALLLCLATPTMAQLSELSGKVIKGIGGEATSLTTNQWYLIYNRGRQTYAYENTGHNMIFVKDTDVPAVGDNANEKCAFLIRLVEGNSAGQYYLQTGRGNYFGSLTQGGSNSVTSAKSVYYTYGTINNTNGHFYFNDANGKIMDANGPGDASLAGWNNGVVTSLNGNNDWAFYAVTVGDGSELSGEKLLQYQLANYSLFRLKNRNAYYTGWANPLLTENENNNLSIKEKVSNTDLSQIWIVEERGGGYVLRNAKTGRYINGLSTGATSTSSSEPKTYYIKYSDNNSDNSTNYITVSATADFSGRNSLHHQNYGCDGGGQNLVVWDAGSGGNSTASDWTLEVVTEVSEEQLKNHFNEMDDLESEVVAGKIYRFISQLYGLAMTEVFADNSVKCMPIDNNNFAQYWKVISNGDNFVLQNILTGRYVQAQRGTLSVPYHTGTSQNTFAINKGSDKWTSTFTITDYSTTGLHCASSQGNYVVGWDIGSEASIWCLKAANITQEEIANAQNEYNEFRDLQDNKSVIQARLMKFFEDYACTSLKTEYANMSDDALRLTLTNNDITNSMLQDMVIKCKNNSWTVYESSWAKSEKSFRVADYKVYSDWDWDAWTGITKNGYCFSRLSNPTGICGKSGDVIMIFVDSDVPQGCTLQIEAVSGTSSTGVTSTLTKGLNSIILSEDANLFIYYTAEVTNDGNGNYSYPKLADIEDIKIHIEGGKVNGYFDLTKGDTNMDWSKLQSYLLKESSVVNLKTDYLMFAMNSSLVKQYCPLYMVELLGMWDNVIKWQQELMGYEDWDGYCNNLLIVSSVDHNYMYASSYGTYYNENTLSSVMSYEQMKSTGAIWGPAHENGHIHQNLINMVGCSEASNNLFSNVAVYRQGYLTMRADELSTTINNFANGVHWSGRDIWEQCYMFTKLYYYYHVLGNNPNFYPNLFRALRNDPMVRRQGVTIRLKDESLKFVRHACDAAGEDLTEFFKVFGFFEHPQDNGYSLGYYKDDYGSFYIDNNPTTVAQDIEETLNYIKGKNYPKNNNIVFIDDRIKPSPANYAGMAAGAVRGDFNNEHPIGSVGDVGQYGDYSDEHKCNGYKFTINNGNVIIEGDGAVGFKVYDNNGDLVYISNTKSFTIPTQILSALGNSFDIVAADANGDDLKVADASKTLYSLDVYYGNNDKKVVYSNGEAPCLSANAIAFVSGNNKYDAPTSLTNGENVVNGYNMAASVTLSECDNFYSPIAFSAAEFNFDREIGAYEMKFIVLPFECSTSNIRGDVYVFDSIKDNMVNFTSFSGVMSANTPYLVYSETDVKIVEGVENVNITATPDNMSVSVNGAVLSATYKTATASDNSFEYIEGGFERLQSEWLPFESVLKFNNETAYDRYIISFNGEPTAIEVAVSSDSLFPADVYDINGRLIIKNADSLEGLAKGVYILKGVRGCATISTALRAN
ncbi:MAG: M60 family metallopeptidase [Muribaculaceae bacterium]|nr:M60 family metallopeptidase [Muribaculaceae bacterium]